MEEDRKQEGEEGRKKNMKKREQEKNKDKHV